MIDRDHNLQLKNLLEDKTFPIGVELVSTRGALSEMRVRKVAEYGEALAHHPEVDWVSITDNAGGHPQLAPIALGTPILYRGKEVIIHLTCKDLNRNSIESQLWFMASHGFHNVLALTGDYPNMGDQGRAKPVFDLDSVSLLSKIKEMNAGIKIPTAKLKNRRIDATTFYAGAVVSPYKRSERTLMPQMLKMEEKLKQGAQFLISQIGYDGRRAQELIYYLREIGQSKIPVIANVYVLSSPVIELFASGKIPGVAFPPKMLNLFRSKADSPDRGKAFFLEFAAQQLASLKSLGYRAGYIGGVSNTDDLNCVLNHFKSIQESEVQDLFKQYPAEGDGYYLYEESGDSTSNNKSPEPSSPSRDHYFPPRNPTSPASRQLGYKISRVVHGVFFNHQHPVTKGLVVLCQSASKVSKFNNILHTVEKICKGAAFGCKDCGDCSLPETTFICPEASCAKNMRNGPCGGSQEDRCEVYHYNCIWARAYDRLKSTHSSQNLLHHAPVVQNHSLRGTSGWMNYWQKQDHQSKNDSQPQH